MITAIDLFAGAGGLSFGFEKAGINVELAIEKDAWAVETYLANHKNKDIIEADICELENSFFKKYYKKIDIIMGGPPCQGFSIAASNRRKKYDSRNQLYEEFIRIVGVIQPKMILIENVKEIVKYRLRDGRLLIDDITGKLTELGYNIDYEILNCRNYGIPQDRKRFFLMGISSRYNIKPNIKDYFAVYEKPEISLWDAISDLPIVRPKEYKEGTILHYKSKCSNEFQILMRDGSEEIHNHIPMQHTDRTIKKMEFILENGDMDLPEELAPRVRGDVEKVSKKRYGQNHRVLDSQKVSPTITASFYSSFIHPQQPRNLTVREAARLQTFPDTFIFHGKKTTLSKKLLSRKCVIEELHLDQFNQVGNAVPPLMGEHWGEIYKKILETLKC